MISELTFGPHSTLSCLHDRKGGEVLLCLVPIVPGKHIRAVEEAGILLSWIQPTGEKSRQLIVVPQDSYVRNPGLYIGRINAVLGDFKSIFARNCSVRKIHADEARTFLEANHSLGYCSAGSFYGMFVERPASSPKHGCMIAVASFSKPRRWRKENGQYNSYEFVRYASEPEIRIAGGMGKMLEAFKADHPDASDIMSYCDLEWSEGNAYRRLGFREEGSTEPQTFWIDTTDWSRHRKPCNGITTTYTNLGSKKFRLVL